MAFRFNIFRIFPDPVEVRAVQPGVVLSHCAYVVLAPVGPAGFTSDIRLFPPMNWRRRGFGLIVSYSATASSKIIRMSATEMANSSAASDAKKGNYGPKTKQSNTQIQAATKQNKQN